MVATALVYRLDPSETFDTYYTRLPQRPVDVAVVQRWGRRGPRRDSDGKAAAQLSLSDLAERTNLEATPCQVGTGKPHFLHEPLPTGRTGGRGRERQGKCDDGRGAQPDATKQAARTDPFHIRAERAAT